MCMMRRKLKDKKICIYKELEGETDAAGFPLGIKYQKIHNGKLWAYVRQLSGKEYYAAMAMHSTEEVVFVVNWRADLTMENVGSLFVEYKGNWYDVQRIDTFEGNKSDISIYAKTLNSIPKETDMLDYAEE